MTLASEAPAGAGRPGKEERSVGALLSDLASETILLVRQELALFKAELHEKLGRAGSGAAAFAAGGLILFSGWLALLAAATLGLAIVLPAWFAALLVALATLAVGALLLLFGKRRLAAKALTPDRTLRSLREDEAWLRERLR